MSFWDFETVNDTPPQEVVTSQGGGDLVFPDGTWVTVSLDEAKWNSFQGGERHISLRASILAPQEYEGVKIANRKLFAKLWIVDGNKEQKKDKADGYKKKHQTLLSTIDAHTGKALIKKALAANDPNWEPTDEDLAACLTNKPFAWRIATMKMQDGKYINFLSGIGAPSRAVEITGKLINQERDAATLGASGGGVDRVANGTARYDDGDEIPF